MGATDSSSKKKFWKTTIKILVTVTVVISLLINIFTFVMPVVKYYGTSMAPSLEDGQILIVSKLSEIQSGDIIAFYYNNKVLVRRVIATGNQQISVDVFGTVKVDGQELNEPYVTDKTLGQSDVRFPYNVPSNSYFVMGDNRAISMDSRLDEIGIVTKDRLVGKIVFSLKPFQEIK